MKKIFSIEYVHLLTGFILIIAGLMSYQGDGISAMVSWIIFGAMYISMSDIGESNMSRSEKKSVKHTIRIIGAASGAIFSLVLLTHFLFT